MKLAIISDIHEDAHNLRRALARIGKLDCDELICLGDIVGFNPLDYSFMGERDAAETISMVRTSCDHVLAGNHDLFALRKLPDHPTRFNYPENWYELDFEVREKMADGKLWLYEYDELSAMLSTKDKAYLDSLPSSKILEYDDARILISHFIYPDLSGSETFKPSKPAEFISHLHHLSRNQLSISFSGHGHIEGAVIASDIEMSKTSFEKRILQRDSTHAIIGPCIARGKKRTGFMIFDTHCNSLEAVAL